MTQQEQARLTKEILDLHNRVLDIGRKSVPFVVECGKKLTEIKKGLPTGKWMKWQEEQHDKISVSTINRYRRIHDLSLVTNLDGKTLDEVYVTLGTKKPKTPKNTTAPESGSTAEGNGKPVTTPVERIDAMVIELIKVASEITSSEKAEVLQALYPIVEYYNDQTELAEAA